MSTQPNTKRLNLQISDELYTQLHTVIPEKMIRRVLEPLLWDLVDLLADEEMRMKVLGAILIGDLKTRDLNTVRKLCEEPHKS